MTSTKRNFGGETASTRQNNPQMSGGFVRPLKFFMSTKCCESSVLSVFSVSDSVGEEKQMFRVWILRPGGQVGSVVASRQQSELPDTILFLVLAGIKKLAIVKAYKIFICFFAHLPQ